MVWCGVTVCRKGGGEDGAEYQGGSAGLVVGMCFGSKVMDVKDSGSGGGGGGPEGSEWMGEREARKRDERG